MPLLGLGVFTESRSKIVIFVDCRVLRGTSSSNVQYIEGFMKVL